MQVDFNVLKGDIDIAEVETRLSREYDEIWSERYHCDTYVRIDIIHTRYTFIKKVRARVERCDRMDARAILPMATRGKGRYPSSRLATLSNSQPIFPLRKPFLAPWLFNILHITFPLYLPIFILLLCQMIFPFVHCGEASFAFYFILFFVTIFSFSLFDLSNRRVSFGFIGLITVFYSFVAIM